MRCVRDMNKLESVQLHGRLRQRMWPQKHRLYLRARPPSQQCQERLNKLCGPGITYIGCMSIHCW